MSAHFGPGANRVFRGILVFAFLSALAIPVALMGWVRTPLATGAANGAEQPIPFDHRHHVRDDGIGCGYCHWAADRSPSAGIPSSGLCMACHGQVLNDSPLLEPIRASVAEDRPIRWVRIHRLPDFVYFDHSAHIGADVACETCHGRVDLMPRVRQVEPLTMGWCLDCHRNPGEAASVDVAPTNCTTCHR